MPSSRQSNEHEALRFKELELDELDGVDDKEGSKTASIDLRGRGDKSSVMVKGEDWCVVYMVVCGVS